MSEELCPSSAECAMPLPFFCRTSNQVIGHYFFCPIIRYATLHWYSRICQGALEARDYYVPNPSCKEFHKFEWIGQLMGAALRGKDFLVSDGDIIFFPHLFQLLQSKYIWYREFFVLNSALLYHAGFGPAWSGMEAVDWGSCSLE